MEYVIFVFRSRSDSVGFSEFLSARGVRNSLINTPKQAKIGCGLSVRTEKDDYERVIRMLSVMRRVPPYAVFIVVNTVRGKEIRRI